MAAALVAASLAAAPAGAGEPRSQLDEIESALEEGQMRQAELDRKAANLSREIASIKTQTVVAARVVQDHEERLLRTGRHLEDLNARTAARRGALNRRRTQMAGTLAALERIARRPPEALAVLPMSPVDAVRGAILLRAALPPLEGRVQALSQELAALAELRGGISRERQELRAGARALQEKRDTLNALMARKTELRSQVRADSEETSERLRQLAEEAKDLRDLVDRLAAAWRGLPPTAPAKAPAVEAPGAPEAVKELAGLMFALPPARPFAEARGNLAMPVRGRTARLYGQTTGAGTPSRGIVIEALGSGRVVAPHDGEVVFAGPFRSYGQLLIIAHGEGYHILLAGLSRIDCVVGQWLLAGEPVGVLTPSEDGNAQIYIELRHNGEPINPLPWMAARDEKVSG
jgi:septal ring factor EnvC (AmiA/AmiB activator)